MRKLEFLLLIVFLCTVFNVIAQNRPTLSGRIVSPNGKAISFANIALLNIADSVIYKGAMTDNKGNFILENVKNGEYYLKVFFVGFETAKVDSIVMEGKPMELSPIILKTKATQLDEIKVVSERGMFESEAGKMVYNVDGNMNAVGESAIELLQNIPSIGTDMDDKVTLRGSKATILIDGVESDLSSMLDQIPSDAIESIEVITNPSARYESKSGAGIVNIKLKKSAKTGYTGKITVGAGTREKKNFAVQAGYNLKKWRLGASGSYKNDKYEDESFTVRETLSNGEKRYMNQDRLNTRKPSSAFVRTNANYYFEEKSFISFQYVLQNRSQTNTSEYETEHLNQDHVLSSKSTTMREGADNNLFNEFSSSFRKDFKKNGKQVLDFNLLYSFNTPLNQYDQLNQPVVLESSVPVSSYTTDAKEYANKVQLLKFKGDYSQPLSPKIKLETGVLSSLHHYYQDLHSERITYKRNDLSGQYEVSASDQNDKTFDYSGYAISSYGLISGSFGKFQFSTGVRAEITLNETKTDSKVMNTFVKIIPSLHLKQIVNEKYSREVSYTSRISPPSYNQLNPISLSWGNYYKSSGNPNLKPEVFYQAEFANHWTHKKGNYVLTLFLKNRSNIIGRWYNVEQDEDGRDVTYSITENLGNVISGGVDGSASLTLKKIVLRPAFSGFFSKINGDKFGPELDKQELSFTTKLTSDYKVSKDLVFQLSARYNSPFISDYGKQFCYYTFDAGFKANMFKRMAALSVKVVDFLNTMEYDKVVNQRANYTSTSHVDPHNFLVYFDLVYKFNSLMKKSKKSLST